MDIWTIEYHSLDNYNKLIFLTDICRLLLIIYRINLNTTVSASLNHHHSWLNRHLYKIQISHHFFAQKVHFLGLFWANFGKISINHQLKTLIFFVDRQRFSDADMVSESEFWIWNLLECKQKYYVFMAQCYLSLISF